MPKKSTNKSINIFVYILTIILPFITVLSSLLPYKISSFSAVSFLKEFIMIIIIIICCFCILKNKKINRSPFYLLIFLFILYGFFHVIITNIGLFIGFDKFRLVYLYPLTFLLILLAFKKSYLWSLNFNTIQKIIIIQAIVMILFGLLQLILKDRLLTFLYRENYYKMQINLFGEKGIRTVSLLGNPINLGLFLNLGMVSLLYTKTKIKYWKLAKWLLIGLSFYIVLTTLSRISIVISVILLIQYFLFNEFNVKKLLLIPIIILLVPIALEFYYQLPNDNIVLKRVKQINVDQFESNIRIVNWEVYLKSALYKDGVSYLWGSGLGSSNSDNNMQSDKIKKVENSYISILGETGVLGLLQFVIIILVYLVNCIKIYLKSNRQIANTLLGYFIIYIIGSVTNDVYQNSPFSYYFWLFLFYSEIYKNVNLKV